MLIVLVLVGIAAGIVEHRRRRSMSAVDLAEQRREDDQYFDDLHGL